MINITFERRPYKLKTDIHVKSITQVKLLATGIKISGNLQIYMPYATTIIILQNSGKKWKKIAENGRE